MMRRIYKDLYLNPNQVSVMMLVNVEENPNSKSVSSKRSLKIYFSRNHSTDTNDHPQRYIENVTDGVRYLEELTKTSEVFYRFNDQNRIVVINTSHVTKMECVDEGVAVTLNFDMKILVPETEPRLQEVIATSICRRTMVTPTDHGVIVGFANMVDRANNADELLNDNIELALRTQGEINEQ